MKRKGHGGHAGGGSRAEIKGKSRKCQQPREKLHEEGEKTTRKRRRRRGGVEDKQEVVSVKGKGQTTQ